jgi:hypothetical protein
VIRRSGPCSDQDQGPHALFPTKGACPDATQARHASRVVHPASGTGRGTRRAAHCRCKRRGRGRLGRVTRTVLGPTVGSNPFEFAELGRTPYPRRSVPAAACPDAKQVRHVTCVSDRACDPACTRRQRASTPALMPHKRGKGQAPRVGDRARGPVCTRRHWSRSGVTGSNATQARQPAPMPHKRGKGQAPSVGDRARDPRQVQSLDRGEG